MTTIDVNAFREAEAQEHFSMPYADLNKAQRDAVGFALTAQRLTAAMEVRGAATLGDLFGGNREKISKP